MNRMMLRRVFLLCLVLLVCVVVVGHIFAYQSNQLSLRQYGRVSPSDVFEMNLFSDKVVYKTVDVIHIWATLEYVGDNDVVTIWHDVPCMVFVLTDGEDFNLWPLSLDIVTSSVLEKGEVYRFDYYKSGAWGSDDPDADFWESFFKEKDLVLPVGEYTITVKGNFYLNDKLEGDSGLLCELKIKVVP